MTTRKPTVLHVTDAWGGGVQTAISTWMAILPAFEHRVVALLRDGEATRRGNEGAVELVGGGLFVLLRRARAIVRAGEADVVHLHSSRAGVLRPAMTIAPLVYSPHCFAFERSDVGPSTRWLFKLVERILARWPQTIAAVSPHERDLAEALGGRASVWLTPNCSTGLREARAVADGRAVITVGRISEQKDPAFFAEVARQLRKKNVGFTWVGDGTPLARQRLEAAGVRVSGWLDEEETESELREANLYLHSAQWESSPFSLIEAASAGLPILCRSIPSLGSLGYWQAGDTPQKVADELLRTLEDPSYREQVSNATDAALSMLTPQIAAAAMNGAYVDAMRRQR